MQEESEQKSVWWRLFRNEKKYTEQRAAKVNDVLASAEHLFFSNWRRNIYFDGLPTTIAYLSQYEEPNTANIIDTHTQFIEYLGVDALFQAGPVWTTPLYDTAKALPKLVPLITQSHTYDESLKALYQLSVNSQSVSDKKRVRSRLQMQPDMDADLVRRMQESEEIMAFLMKTGYEHFRQFRPALITVP